jgi:hypothetical protein
MQLDSFFSKLGRTSTTFSSAVAVSGTIVRTADAAVKQPAMYLTQAAHVFGMNSYNGHH